jgi:WD40 repeat protein
MPRTRTIAIVVALVLAAILGIAGFVFLQPRGPRPRRTYTLAQLGGMLPYRMALVGHGQGLALCGEEPLWNIHSVDTGKLVHTVRGKNVESGPPWIYQFDAKDELDLVDPWTLEKKSFGPVREIVAASSTTGDEIAFVGKKATIEVRSVGGVRPPRSFAVEAREIQNVEFSPEGDKLVVDTNGAIFVLSASTGEELAALRHSYSLGFASTGELLTLQERRPEKPDAIVATDLVTKKERTVFEGSVFGSRLAQGSRDRIALRDEPTEPGGKHERMRVLVIAVSSGKVLREIIPRNADMIWDLSSEGESLAILCRDGPVEIWDVPGAPDAH